MPRRKKIQQLPKHVHLKKGEWYVGISFPTAMRRPNGALIYDQFARRCYPETTARAQEIAAQITASYTASLQSSKPSDRQTLVEFLTIFIAAKEKSLARRTFEFYTEQFDWYIKESAFGKNPLGDIKPLIVQKFYDDLLQGADGASSDAVRKLHQFLSAAFNQAVRWEVIAKNPAKGVILPKKNEPDVAAMTAGEVRRLMKICRASLCYVVFEFALETAMRPEEYLALTWNDVDLINCTASVRRAVAVGFKGGGFEFKETKTRGSERSVAFSPELAERLKLHRAAQTARVSILDQKTRLLSPHGLGKKSVRYKRWLCSQAVAHARARAFEEYDLVFPSAAGKPLSRLNLNRRDFKAALCAAQLDEKKFSLYSLRRTAATLLASKINPKELASFLGHKDVSTSLKYYVLMTDDSKHRASNALAALLRDT